MKWLQNVGAWLRAELRALATVQSSDRLWQMPLFAALAMGLPLLAGAWLGRMGDALVASLGALVFLYLPNTPLSHRMVALMACAFAMTACFAFGLLSALAPVLMMPVLVFLAIGVTMLARFYALGPPGSLFFIMAAAIGAYAPAAPHEVPARVGLFALGCLLAFFMAFVYSVYTIRLRKPAPVVPLPKATFDFVVFDAVVIGVFVGISLALAQLLQLEKAYWVPVSCLAVIQGASLRAVWSKQLHRVLGTAAGMALAYAVLLLPLGAWGMSLLMMGLSFLIELMVVRHYALAVTLITPLTILLAEAATLGHGSTSTAPLIQARFLDTLLGCLVGLAGGVCLHSPRFRRTVGGWMLALAPARFRQGDR